MSGKPTKHEFKMSMHELIELAARQLIETRLPHGNYTVSSQHSICIEGRLADVGDVHIFVVPRNTVDEEPQTLCDHDWVRDGHYAYCAREGCDHVRKPQGDEREATESAPEESS
jgi:hypothetical protein